MDVGGFPAVALARDTGSGLLDDEEVGSTTMAHDEARGGEGYTLTCVVVVQVVFPAGWSWRHPLAHLQPVVSGQCTHGGTLAASRRPCAPATTSQPVERVRRLGFAAGASVPVAQGDGAHGITAYL